MKKLFLRFRAIVSTFICMIMELFSEKKRTTDIQGNLFIRRQRPKMVVISRGSSAVSIGGQVISKHFKMQWINSSLNKEDIHRMKCIMQKMLYGSRKIRSKRAPCGERTDVCFPYIFFRFLHKLAKKDFI